MQKTPLATMQVQPVIGKTLTPEQVAYVAAIVDDITDQKGPGPFTSEYIETILLDPHAFETVGQDFLKKSEVIRQHILAGDTGMTPEMAEQFDEQHNLRAELHESLFKSMVLAEHAQKICEQALQRATAEYGQGYRMIMQQRLAEHQQQIVTLEHMLAESAA